MKKIDVSGGPPTTLCDARSPGGGGTWGRDGIIMFSNFEPDGGGFVLKKVSASGGVPSDAVPDRSGESRIRPSFLPDGRHFLYASALSVNSGATMSVYAGSIDSADRVKLPDAGSTNAQYAMGDLLFLRDGTLMAQPFDAKTLKTTGDLVPVAEQIQRQGVQPPYGLFSASADGILVYQTGAFTAGGSQLTWMDRAGKPIAAIGDRVLYLGVALSPDEKRAAVVIGTNPIDLWIVDLARGVRTRFTFDPPTDVSPVWSPDGSRIAFGSIRKRLPDLYQKASNGAEAEELVLASDEAGRIPLDWSPDGRFLLYGVASPTTSNNASDLWLLPLFGDRKPFPFLATPFAETSGKFSPDGRWIAYTSNESGQNEVYVAPFTAAADGKGKSGSGNAGGKWQVSSGAGSDPKWRGDGKEIFYFAPGSRRLMATAVNGQASAFEVGATQPLARLGPPQQQMGLPTT